MILSLEIISMVLSLFTWLHASSDDLTPARFTFAFLCLAVVCEAIRLHFGA